MAESLPSATEQVPVLNRRGAIIGLPLSFFVLATLAVGLRLYVRVKVVRQLGLDDLFVILSYLVSFGAIIFIFEQTNHGLGKHAVQIITARDWTIYLICQYASNALYQVATTLIKLSILFQYLRVFKNSLLTRRFCYVMLILVTLWGLSFFFVQIFTCSPVSFYWHRRGPGRCWGFGSNNPVESFTAYVGQTSSNMVFDLLILFLPIPALATLKLDRKQKWGLAGLFTLGSAVGVTSVLRLENIIAHRAGTVPTYDIPWWTPPLIIISAIEIDLAIVCASMPIFWPVLSNWKQFSNIVVVNEVEIRREKRRDLVSWRLDADVEDHAPMGRKGTMSSRGMSSQEELSLKGAYQMEMQDLQTKSRDQNKEYYQNNWRQGDLVPSDQTVQVNIRGSGPSLTK